MKMRHDLAKINAAVMDYNNGFTPCHAALTCSENASFYDCIARATDDPDLAEAFFAMREVNVYDMNQNRTASVVALIAALTYLGLYKVKRWSKKAHQLVAKAFDPSL